MSGSAEIDDRTVFVVAEEVLSNKLADEEAILNLKSGVYYGLDPVGARVWELVQTPISLAKLLETLLAEYDVEPGRLRRDITALLEKLLSEGLVVIGNAKTP